MNTFSRKGKNKEVQELATHLKDIIKFEKKYIAKNENPEKPASDGKKAFILIRDGSWMQRTFKQVSN